MAAATTFQAYHSRRQASLTALFLAVLGVSAVSLGCLRGKSQQPVFVQTPSAMVNQAGVRGSAIAEVQPRSLVIMHGHVAAPDYRNIETRARRTEHIFDEDGGMYDIIKYPILTERACRLIEEFNTYSFLVDRRANKPQIRAAIETIFNVKVKKCNTLIPPAKYQVRFGIKIGRKSVYKKAMCRLEEGYSIDLFPDDPEKVE